MLPGGLRVVSEQVPGVRSVAFGVWVGVGSRDETKAQTGSAHYLEHLLFKGTRRRTAWEISSVMDAVGGEMNAFTTKEYTCFYARVLAEDLPLAVDVVCDVVTDGLLDREDVENERGVILEEIAMNDDDPSDGVHDLAAAQVFGDHGLGRPILGSEATINALSRDSIASFYRRRYRPEAMVIAAAGRVDHAALVRAVKRAFAGRLDSDALPALPRRGKPIRLKGLGETRVVSRPTEQAHICLTLGGISRHDPRRYVLGVLNAGLGGGMSSRLFQEVREKRGLAYSVFSFTGAYADTGVLGVYAGCLPAKADSVIDLCRSTLQEVAEYGLGDAELARAKGQLRGSMVLGQEDTGARMSHIGKAELLYGDMPGLDDVLLGIDSVTREDVRILAQELLFQAPALSVVGPFDPDHEFTAVPPGVSPGGVPATA